MNASSFVNEVKAPKALIPHLEFLNLGEDYSPYLCEPDDWLALSNPERALHGLKFLHNAWQYWKKRVPTKGIRHDSVKEAVFCVLVQAAGKLHEAIHNPGGYLFTAIKNETQKEIERQRPQFLNGDLDNLLTEGAAYRRGRLGKSIRVGSTNFGNEDSFHALYEHLDACCENDLERTILHERWRKVSEGWVDPSYASDIAHKHDLPLAYIVEVLEDIQARGVARINDERRRKHQPLISPVQITHISPDQTTPALSS